jgi:putative aminopeptidase FrvX
MKKLPQLNEKYLIDTLQEMLLVPSPTGYTDRIIDYLGKKLAEFPGIKYHRTAKGGLVVSWEGDQKILPRALTAHVDTLGAMVKEVKTNGRLKLSQLESYAWSTIEGEGCIPQLRENSSGFVGRDHKMDHGLFDELNRVFGRLV